MTSSQFCSYLHGQRNIQGQHRQSELQFDRTACLSWAEGSFCFCLRQAHDEDSLYKKAVVECVLERPWLEVNLTAVPVPTHCREKDFLVVVCRVCSWCPLTGNLRSAGVTCGGMTYRSMTGNVGSAGVTCGGMTYRSMTVGGCGRCSDICACLRYQLTD